MLKAIVAHNNAAINDFSQLASAEIMEYDIWSDSVTSDITDDELEDMFQQEEAYRQRLYQSAKFKFDTLHTFSQPDSLTRRGEMLILRRAVTVEQANNGVIDDWRETLTDLFKYGVTVCQASVDRQYNLRIWFLLDVCYGLLDADYMPFDDELDALPHNAAAIKANNWQEVA
jgi:hypothetical protein